VIIVSFNLLFMKKIFLVFIVSLLLIINGSAQNKLGDAASVYITTPNLDSSMALYSKLGFKKTGANEFPVPWVQVSDGSLLITMRKDVVPYIGLTYYSVEVDKIAAALLKDSIVFSQQPKPGDAIKRYYIKSPDGFTIILSDNPGGFTQPTGSTLINMKPADFNAADKYPNQQCGAFGEFAHPVTDIKKSVVFWKKLGFKSTAEMTAPYPHVILYDGLMIIGLHQTQHFAFPAITYFGINTAARIEKLKANGVTNFSEVAGKNNVSLKTWEGQQFFIFSLGL
jgi:predicted lactoylglutathione lyase